MTQLPALVRAAAAACAFLTLSYAVSVFAGPGTGTEDLGRGGPDGSAGVYRRDPFPAPRRTAPASEGDAVALVGIGWAGGRDSNSASPAIPVSARTGVAEAATGPADLDPASVPEAPVPAAPGEGTLTADPLPSVQPGKAPRSRPGSGSATGGSGPHSASRPARGHKGGHAHGEARGSGGRSGCEPGPAKAAKARKAERAGRPPQDRSPRRHGRR